MRNLFAKQLTEADLFGSARAGDLRLVQKVLAAGIPIDVRDVTDRTALCIAAKHGHLEVVKFLLGSGADVNILTKEGRTPIYFAVHSGLLAMVKLVLEAGGQLDVSDTLGYSPLGFALDRHQWHLTEVLRGTPTAEPSA